MFEFYFPHLMESTPNGSWWPSLIGALLGALVSGLFAVGVFKADIRYRRKQRENELKNLLLIFFKFLSSQVKYKNKVLIQQKNLENKLREKPFQLHSPPFESTHGNFRLLQYNPLELTEAAEQYGLSDAQSVVSHIFNDLDNMLIHAELCNEDLPIKFREWAELTKEFKLMIENVRSMTSEISLNLQFRQRSEQENAALDILNNITADYLQYPPKGVSVDLTYHYHKLPKAILLNLQPAIVSQVNGLHLLVNSSIKAKYLYLDIEAKSIEIADFLRHVAPELPVKVKDLVKIIRKVDSDFILENNKK